MGSDQPGISPPLTGAYLVLEPEVGQLVSGILRQRDPELHARLTLNSDVTQEEVGRVELTLYREFVEQLSENWEPSEYGKRVDNAIGAFVKRFLIERGA